MELSMIEQSTSRPAHLRLITGTADEEQPGAVVIDHPTRQRAARRGTLIRVLVAEDRALLRAGYRALLENEDRIAVVGEAATASEAIALAAETQPNVLLLDMSLPGLDDLAAMERTISDPAFAGVAVMLIAASENDERVSSALRAGAVGFLANEAEPVELIRGVYMLARGDALISGDAVRRLLREPPPERMPYRASSDQLEELTDREREVMALVAKGLSNDEIAERLVVSPATARTHVGRAMMKLRAHDRAQLVVLAYETGLVLPGVG
jgi:DNA-binding NarL/FixJ family response regulator